VRAQDSVRLIFRPSAFPTPRNQLGAPWNTLGWNGREISSNEGTISQTTCGGSLRIAQVAPLYESVPPKCYGGTERIVSGVTEELVRRGHRVALFASGDSTTAAKLIPCCPQGL